MLIVARAAQALGGSGGIVLARAIVRDLYSGARAGRELSLMGAVMALAPVLAPLIGGVLQTVFGWRSLFVVLVADRVYCAALIWLLLPETLSARAAEPVSPSSMLRSYRVVARNRGLSRLSRPGLDQCSPACSPGFPASSFVLQDLYGLSPFDIRRRLRGRFGRLPGRHDTGGAARDAGSASTAPSASARWRDGGRRARAWSRRLRSV